MTALGWAVILPALVAWAVIAALRGSRLADRLADHPNPRSLHVAPRPRIGGLGVAAGILPFALAFATTPPLAAIVTCALGVAIVSLVDDFRSLPIEVRLPAHLVAAGVAVLALAQPATPWPWGWAGAALGVLGIVWAANLYNFMDGADGLAGGMGAIGFAALAAAASAGGYVALALICAAIASACAGFLAHNFPPARVFLGDSGSVPLGFLAATLGLHGTLAGAWPAWFAPLVFSPFIVDASVTLALRVARARRFWLAHREHGYQRLALAGWPRRRLALAAWALMGAAAASALVARAAGETTQCAILFVWATAYALIVPAVGLLTRRKAQAARVDPQQTSRMPE
jgi:UDP-N-acetylmuramyl pentapeptide phosphotransferase/UDP-N-acetylglucosamine-1-phosphate transferase